MTLAMGRAKFNDHGLERGGIFSVQLHQVFVGIDVLIQVRIVVLFLLQPARPCLSGSAGESFSYEGVLYILGKYIAQTKRRMHNKYAWDALS